MTDNRTTELREKLAERGVEYTTDDGEHVKSTCWRYMGKLMAEYAEFDNGTTCFACDNWCFTPDQAIAATLGSGTCENEWAQFGKFRCSECWTQVDAISTNTTAPIPIKYCPNCGAKVIQGVYEGSTRSVQCRLIKNGYTS